MEDTKINSDAILNYVRNCVRKIPNISNDTENFLHEMENFAADKNNIPISRPESIKFISLLAKMINAKHILEIGTAIGYSAIYLSLASGAEVLTLELNEDMAKIARENIEEAKLSEKIKVMLGDANESLLKLGENSENFGKFDLIFIDAAKTHYGEYLKNSAKLLQPGGIVVSDNVLFRGYVAAPDSEFPKRYRGIVRAMKKYVANLLIDENFDTSIVPIGDGIAVSLKL
jgi:predicted O-methyltransferase YrrM